MTSASAAWERVATPRNAVLIAFAVVWGVLRWCFTDLADDAFITWRYALNLVEGRGFVFNPGEPVYGTTAPLFAVFTAAGMKLGFEPWNWVLAWDVIWGAGILWRLRQVLELGGVGRWFPLAAGAVLLASMETLATPGMETGLYCFLILSALACAAQPDRAGLAAMAWASGAACLRPDGILVVIAVAPFVLAGPLKEKRWKQALLTASPLAMGAAYALFLLAVFGTIVPQTVEAKAARIASDVISVSTFDDLLFEYFLDWRRGPGSAWPLAPNFAVLAGAAAMVFLAWRQASIRPLAAFAVIYALFFALGRAPRFDWYLVPLAVIVRAFSGVAAGLVAKRAAGLLLQIDKPGKSWVRGTALVLAVLVQFPQGLVLAHQIGWNAGATGVQKDLKRYGAAAEWIMTEGGDPDPFIGSNEVGQLGYFSGGTIYDSEGLVTPGATALIREGWDPLEILRLSGVDWLVAYFHADVPLEDQYWYRRCVEEGFRPVKTFEGHRWSVRTIVFKPGADAGAAGRRQGAGDSSS